MTESDLPGNSLVGGAREPHFAGFPGGSLASTPVPNLFLAEALPRIDSLAELRISLQAMRLLGLKKSQPRYLVVADFLADPAVVATLPEDESAARLALDEALGAAVSRGTLARLGIEQAGKITDLYFLNNAEGRRTITGALAGRLDLGQERFVAPEPAVRLAERPNAYLLYEQNIGLLTPLVAEEIDEAQRLYPADWVEAAFRQAVSYNRRNWKYIQRILERWAVEGRQDEEVGGGTGRPGARSNGRRGRAEGGELRR